MKQSLADEEINLLFAQSESDVVKENHPKMKDLSAKVITQGGRRIVVIDYSRPGVYAAERVRQYSFPVGQNLFRLTCIALPNEFKRYEMTFVEIAGSFKSAQSRP